MEPSPQLPAAVLHTPATAAQPRLRPSDQLVHSHWTGTEASYLEMASAGCVKCPRQVSSPRLPATGPTDTPETAARPRTRKSVSAHSDLEDSRSPPMAISISP